MYSINYPEIQINWFPFHILPPSFGDGGFQNVKDRNTSLAAPGALAHHLQRRTAYKIQNGQQGLFLGVLSNFR